MNVIQSYLETMFSKYPQTPRLLEAKAELQGMMEDAYSSLISDGKSENEAIGKVIKDFGNIDEVAPVLGITSELRGSGPGPSDNETAENKQPFRQEVALHPPVTLAEAKKYSTAQKTISSKVGLAVAAFVLSPALIISLPTASSLGLIPINNNVASFVGLLAIFLFVAAGVILILFTERNTGEFRRISSGRFLPNPEVTRWAEQQAEEYDSKRIRSLQTALAFWILSPLPLLAFSLLLDDSHNREMWTVVGVVFILAMVAIGLLILIPNTWAQTVYETLSKTTSSGKTPEEEENSIVGVIAAFYWPGVTAIYLAWSFIANAWATSWVIWPVAGVLFGALAAGINAVESYKKARR